MDTVGLSKNRNDAKSTFSKYYFTGKSCKNGHISIRQTSNGTCIDCNRGYALKHYAENSGSRKKQVKEYQLKNKDKTRAWQRQSYINNKKSYCVRTLRRHFLKIIHTPKWLSKSDRIKIIQIYKERIRLTKLTGIELHVDHVIPLNGKTVSGLHVPWNLQILTAFDNISKSNKLLPEYL